MEGYVAILMPVLLVGVIFFFVSKMERNKYNAIIEVSKNLDDSSKIEEILDTLNDKKKPIDYRRGGVITLFVGLGLFLFGAVSSIDILNFFCKEFFNFEILVFFMCNTSDLYPFSLSIISECL